MLEIDFLKDKSLNSPVFLWLAILLVAVFYLFFPTNNSTMDGYNYAALVKYGIDLFSFHHLLNGFVFYWILKPFQYFNPNIDVLKASIFLNSVFAIINLILVSKILKKLRFQNQEIALLILFVGFSFNFWRFGTENEVYILPITFSLLGSYFLLKYLLKRQSLTLFLSGFFAAFACLFHQIHFFWWLGIIIGVIFYFKNFRTFFLYSISAILVPIVYALVIVFYENKELNFTNYYTYIFHDYISGSAKNELGIKNFLFTAISLVRTFFQVHPNILFLMKHNFLFAFPILFAIYFLYQLIRSILKRNLLERRQNIKEIFLKIHIGILILQLFFAFLAVGNVEFMVMVSVLLCFTFFYYFRVNFTVLKGVIILLFAWNFTFGIFMNNHYKLTNENHFIQFALSHRNNFFIVNTDNFVGEYFYKKGVGDNPNVIQVETIENAETIKKLIKNGIVYTNVIDVRVTNRKKLVGNDEKISLLKQFKLIPVEKYQTFYGENTVYKVEEK